MMQIASPVLYIWTRHPLLSDIFWLVSFDRLTINVFGKFFVFCFISRVDMSAWSLSGQTVWYPLIYTDFSWRVQTVRGFKRVSYNLRRWKLWIRRQNFLSFLSHALFERTVAGSGSLAAAWPKLHQVSCSYFAINNVSNKFWSEM